MYSKDGVDYYVIDGHTHFWDGSPANQINRYGEGFIKCFHDYHSNLSPALSLVAAASSAPGAAAGVVRRRERLGIVSSWAFCDDRGEPLDAVRLPGWLRFARTVRVSIEGNAGFCRGLLETRYGPSGAPC